MDQRQSQDSFGAWRLTVGILVGITSTVALYSIVYLYMVTGYCVNCSFGQTVQSLLFLLVVTSGSVGMGALVGKIAGRLEAPIAVGAGIIGLVILGYLPDSFADPVTLVISAMLFLILVTVGAMLVFFRSTPRPKINGTPSTKLVQVF